MAVVLREGDEFSSFTELKERLDEFEKANSLSLYIRDSRTIEAAKKKGLKRTVLAPLVYYSVQFACYHGGKKFKSRSGGKRPHQWFVKQI